MNPITITLNEIDCMAFREALVERYQVWAKEILKRDPATVSPIFLAEARAVADWKAFFKMRQGR